MEGVFDPEQIYNCTVTGRSWHAGGAEALAAKHDPLHPKALRAIVGKFYLLIYLKFQSTQDSYNSFMCIKIS